jgi:outer membrane protein, heavy metal efflux system
VPVLLRFRSLPILLLFCFATLLDAQFSVEAAPEGSAPQTLTLEEALALAQTNSPRLQGSAAAAARADARVTGARAYTNPQVEFFAGHQSALKVPQPGVPGLLTHYAAYQTWEIPRERRNRRRVAEIGREGEQYRQQGVQLSVSANVKHAFYTVIRQREEIKHSRENLALVQDLRKRVEAEVQAGEKGRLELTRAEAELARANFAVRSAQIELANATAMLRVAMAAPPDANYDPQGDLEGSVKLPPLAELRPRVLTSHPAIAETRTDTLQARAALEHERARRIPAPTFFAEYEKQPDLSFWRAGVILSLPAWDRRAGQLLEANATIREASAIEAQRKLEITSALERAYEQYQLADQQVTSLESGSMHEAESAVEAAKAAYRFGERGIVEVLDAQRVLQNVRGDLLDAKFARQAARTDLEELGALTPRGRP